MRILAALLMILPLAAVAQTRTVDVVKPASAERVPAHTPVWTDTNDSDPGRTDSTMADLQKIVVLCATEPQSPDFRRHWNAFVRRNYEKGMDIDAMVDDVMKRAAEYRARHKLDTQGKMRVSAGVSTRKMMHDVAMNAVRNMK